MEIADLLTRLHPGDLLVAFTDGIMERHRGRTQFGREGIVSVLRETGEAGADTIAARVERAARDLVDDEADDDMAVLVVRVPPAAERLP